MKKIILLVIFIMSAGVVNAQNGYAISLDGGESFGINDDASNHLDVSSSWTFEAWIKVNSYTSGNYDCIMDRRTVFSFYLIDDDDKDYAVAFAARDGSDKIIAYMDCDGSGSTSADMVFGTWYHVAATFDGTTAKLYVNGTEMDSDTDTDWNLTASTNAINIGGRYWGGYSRQMSNADIDEVRMSNIARAIGDMQTTTSSAAYSSDSHTVFLMHLDDKGDSPTYVSGTGLSGSNFDDDINSYDYVSPSGLPLFKIFVDGDCTDWTGTASGTAHATTVSNDEWIYTGESSDRRTDGGMSDDQDITEVRVIDDGNSLFGLIKLSNLSDITKFHAGLAIGYDDDANRNYNWIGANSNTGLGAGGNQLSERNIDIHWTGSDLSIEMIDGGSWYAPPGDGAASRIAYSTTNNCVEFSISLTDLGTSSSSTIYYSLVTFVNQQGSTSSWWNNDGDGNTTKDYTSSDGVDVMTPGYSGSDNSWNRDLSDGDVDYYGQISLSESAVPVELTFFTANVSGSNVKLNWKTATEINNYGFEIQRSTENSEWQKIGFIEGAGNSNSPKEYSFTDNIGKSGNYFYRLKQIDINGEYKYSNVVEVSVGLPTKFELKQNYPNPFNPTTTIKYSIPSVIARSGATRQSAGMLVQLKVYDMLGREVATLVNKEQTPGNYAVEFDASSLSSGVYFYALKAGEFTATKKMILMK